MFANLALGLALAAGGPSVDHKPVATAPAGLPLLLTATIHSDNGVFQPVVTYRHRGEASWSKVPFVQGAGDSYTATLPPEALGTDVEYYVETFDTEGNGPVRAGSPEAPFHLAVLAPAPVAMAPEPVVVKKAGGGGEGRVIAGAAVTAVGAAGVAFAIYGFAERGVASSNASAATADVRSVYQPYITGGLEVGIVGAVVGVAGLGVGIWLLASGLSSGSAKPPEEDHTFSWVPLPGGGLASYAQRF